MEGPPEEIARAPRLVHPAHCGKKNATHTARRWSSPLLTPIPSAPLGGQTRPPITPWMPASANTGIGPRSASTERNLSVAGTQRAHSARHANRGGGQVSEISGGELAGVQSSVCLRVRDHRRPHRGAHRIAPSATLLGLQRVIVVMRHPPQDPMPCAEIRLSERDVKQFQRNLTEHHVLSFFKTKAEGTDLDQILRAEAVAREGTHVAD
jgi:hypothetical protein